MIGRKDCLDTLTGRIVHAGEEFELDLLASIPYVSHSPGGSRQAKLDSPILPLQGLPKPSNEAVALHGPAAHGGLPRSTFKVRIELGVAVSANAAASSQLCSIVPRNKVSRPAGPRSQR